MDLGTKLLVPDNSAINIREKSREADVVNFAIAMESGG